jgi:hypothetical protein
LQACRQTSCCCSRPGTARRGSSTESSSILGRRRDAPRRPTSSAIAPVGSGRTVVLLGEAIPTDGDYTGVASPARVAEARRHLSVLRMVARADPARVRLVDLDRWLCPRGAPCPTRVAGIVPRPEDGGHFSVEGAAWLAPRLLDKLGLTAR